MKENFEIQMLREQILNEIDLSRDVEDEEIKELIRRHCGRYAKEHVLTLRKREELEQFLFHALRKLDVLQELLEDAEITEIMVNGANHIFYEKKGHLFKYEKTFTSKEKLEDIIQQIAGSNNRMINLSNPIVDAITEEMYDETEAP